MLLLFFLLLAAVYFDVRFFRIPNPLIVLGIITGLLYRYLLPGELLFYVYPLGMVGMFLLLIPLYRIHAIGGGDVKLLSVCALFTGLRISLSIAVYALCFGGFFSILYLVYHRFFSKQRQRERHVIHFSISIFLGATVQWLWGGFIWQI